MRHIHPVLFTLVLAIAPAGFSQEFDFQAMEDARKVAAHLKCDYHVQFDGGPLNKGTAVYNADRDLAFWVFGDTIYTVNDRAKAAAPDLPKVPGDMSYDAVYEASSSMPLTRELRPGEIAGKGRKMSAEEARKMEETVLAQPSDVWARTMLLGYYGHRRFTSEEDRKAFEQQVLWLITNVPEAAVVGSVDARLDPTMNSETYGQAAALIKEQVGKAPQNLRLLANAAEFFLISDAPYATECLKKCSEIEPDNPRWHEKLGFIHSLSSGGFPGLMGSPDSSSAKAALAEQERALELTTDRGKKSTLMRDLSETALDAGDTEKARKYATEILENAKQGYNWDRGNLIHTGNSILGRIALKEGDIAKANACLVAAGKCGGSPQLDSFGPDMTLASELLAKGERESVVKYLELCGGFWNKAATELWISEIRNGRQVDLNPMLAMAFNPPRPPESTGSRVIQDGQDNWNRPLFSLPMPGDRLMLLDTLYGVPLLLLIAFVLWVRLFSSWQHLWILLPLALVYVVPITVAAAIPSQSRMLFGLGGANVQHLVSVYFGSLALLWLLSDLLARMEPAHVRPTAVAIMMVAGALGTVNYPYRYHVVAEILTFILVVVGSFSLARHYCSRRYSAARFITLLFVFCITLMLVIWPVLWMALSWAVFPESPGMMRSALPHHLLISLVNGVGLCVFLIPFLLVTACVPLYRDSFRKLLRIPSCLQQNTGTSPP